MATPDRGREDRLVSGGADGTVNLWNVLTRDQVLTLKAHEERVTSVAFSPNGKMLASVAEDRTVKVWRAASEEEVAAVDW